MEFWFIDYDRESFDRNFLKVDYAKYLNRALSSLPVEELYQSVELSENRTERLLQDQLLEQHGLLISFFDEINLQVEDQKSHFKDFIRITSLFLQVEKLYIQQYWEFDLLKDFILNRLFASFLRFFKFLQAFHSSVWNTKLRVLKTSQFEDNGQLDKIFSNSLFDLSKREELLLRIEDLIPFQQYFQMSLETLAKSFDRSVATLPKEKLFINQLAYVAKNFLTLDMHYLLQDCKSRFADCESFVMHKILQDNDSDIEAINKMQQDIEYTERKKTSNVTERDLSTLDPHIIDNIFEGVMEQYNPNSKKNNFFDQDLYPEKGLSRQPTGGGTNSQRESVFDQPYVGSQKNINPANGKNRKTFMKGEFEIQRKTILDQDPLKKTKNSYAFVMQNNFNIQKKNSRIDNSLKVKAFGQRTISNVGNREKSDSITEAPKEQNAYNPNTTKLGARFDKDTILNYSSLQPQIDYQKNLDSALEDNRYKTSPNFVRNNYENPLLRYINLSALQNEDEYSDEILMNKKSLSIYASFGLLDRNSTNSPKKSTNEIDKNELFSQMNEKLNPNLLDFLTSTSGNLAEIRPEDIKFEKNDDKNDDKDLKKKKKNLKEMKADDEKSSTHIKTQTIEEKDPALEEGKKKKNENFFSKNKKKKERSEQKFKKINEKDFIKIDENTEIKGKLEYVDIDEQPATDIKDCELFDLNYKSEEETMKATWTNNGPNDNNTFKFFFDKLEREEYIRLMKTFSPNNPNQLWKKVRNTFSSDFNLHLVMNKILADQKIPEIKRRDFDFKRKRKLIVSNTLGQNCFI